MNYLAHQFLSFQNADLQLGNLYGEIVRGKDFENFTGDLRKGILLHRSIDTFTDAHEIVKKSSKKFHDKYGKYAPIIVDVVYDYYLIKNWHRFTDLDFEEFTENAYQLFRMHFDEFPPKLQYIMKHLLDYDWFHNYQSLEGIGKTLNGISQRSKFQNNIGSSVKEIEENYEELDQEFQAFFPELIQHCQNFISNS
ncbi:acyl carrier protein phosphodiesterase [Moheibacter stercoris]|uniref:Acyl carrier protein phosphodiesterase n=1 Tax=Moheibacter stercoris TaxID=1628251 RepID=A0ABV2LTB7_9FLAO